MDIRFSPEQQALRDSAARLVDQLGPHSVAEVGDPERVAKLDAAVTTSGWRELRDATGDDAPVASGVEAAIIAEELGRGLADVSFFGPVMAGELRRLAGAPPGATGETIALVADLSSMAQAVDGGTGRMVAIDVQGSTRTLLLVPGRDGLWPAETALPPGSTGVDLTRPSVALDPAVPVTLVERSVRPMTTDALRRWTALGLSLACADLVGTMRGAVQLAGAYAAERHQYGAAIGSFQAIQHLLADAYVLTEGSRSVTLHAAWAVDELAAGDALAAAALAKAYCARAARNVCETAIQVHGGIGNTWECSAHLFLRRSLLSGDLLGDVGASLARVLGHHGIGIGGIASSDGASSGGVASVGIGDDHGLP